MISCKVQRSIINYADNFFEKTKSLIYKIYFIVEKNNKNIEVVSNNDDPPLNFFIENFELWSVTW